MESKKVNAIIAAMLIFVLTFANICVLGMNVAESFATGIEKNNEVENEVEFSTNFEGSTDNPQVCVANIDEQNLKLNLEVKVNTGCIENSVVIFENPNFKLVDNAIVIPQVADNEVTQEMLSAVQNIDVDYGCVYLNQLSKGTNIKIQIPLAMKNDYNVQDSYFNQNTEVKFEGNYISEDGTSKSLAKSSSLNLIWYGDVSGKVVQGLIKYVPYDLNNKKGIVVETKVSAGIENNKLPCKEINMQVKVPSINNEKPISVEVISNNNQKIDWTNSEDVLNIKIVNELNSQNQINWDRDNLNSINIICKYDENAYASVINEDKSLKEIVLNQTVSGNVSVFNNEDKIVDINSNGNLTANQKINDVVSVNTTYNNGVDKGYLYFNSDFTTPYNVNYAIDISNKDIIDEVSIESGIDSVVKNDGTEISLKINDISYSRYNKTKILKSEFLNILGEDGKIDLYNGDTIIYTIDNNTEVDEDGYIVLDYQNEINNYKLVTSKPINDGILNIYNEKIISNLKIDTNILKDINSLRNHMTFKALNANKKVDEVTSEEIVEYILAISVDKNSDIPMIEPVTKTSLEMNNSGLTTVIDNNNIEIRAILKSNNVSCMLYKNPTLEIVLPEEFEEFNVNNVKLLFSDEMQIASATLTTNENGRKIINVALNGTQTQYNLNKVSEGPMVVINANIKVNKLTPSSKKDIEMYVVNNNDIYNVNYENNVDGRNKVTKTVEFIGPSGLVTGNTMIDENQETSSVNGEDTTVQTETRAEAKRNTMQLVLINNNEDICTDIQILGRTPFEGNKDIQTGEDLGSTFTATLVSGIRTNDIDMANMTVYYSYKEDATMDLTEENGWTETPADYAQVRSYLIKLNGAMVPGAKITFNYDVLVPNDLGFNASTRGTYKVDYKTVSKNNVILKDTVAATSVGLQTEAEPNLAVVVSSNKGENAVVKEGEFVTYVVSVTNNGSEVVSNAKINTKVSDGMIYVDYNEEADFTNTHYTEDPTKKEVDFGVDSLNPQETKTYKYIAKVDRVHVETADICKEPTHWAPAEYIDENGDRVTQDPYHLEQYKYAHDLSEYSVDISNSASVSVSGYQINSNEYKVKAQRGYLNVEMTSDPLDSYDLIKGNEITYSIDITNISVDRQLDDVVAKMNIQKGLEFEEANISYYKNNQQVTINDGINYDSNSGLLTANIGTLVGSIKDGATDTITNVTLNVKVKVGDGVTDAENKGEIYSQVAVTGKDINLNKDIDTYYSNQIIHKVQKSELYITLDSDVDTARVLSAGDQVTYTITVKNNGTGYASNVAINDVISDTGSFVSGKLVIDDKETRLISPSTVCNILAGQTAKMYITVAANTLDKENVLTNTADVESDTCEKITSNTFSHRVTSKIETVVDKNGQVVRVYRVSGTAWLDSNKNGARDTDEKLASNVPIVLINSEDGSTVATGKTDSKGKYEITGIPEGGKYNIVFLYDNARFDVTTYQKEGVDESKNSDAICMNIKVDGTSYRAGVTDTLIFDGANYYNIDIGLVENQKFDMSLTKGISKITVKTKSNGSEVRDYNNTQMAKIDLPGKTVDGSTVAIEYTITVKNEGAVAGRVKNIVDYMPKDLKFSGDLNKGWYSGESGYLYNSSLANKLLQPGESTQVKLVLTKQMTTSNLGLTVNTAEISEATNDQGLEDFDSIPGNKKSGEDDYSTANLVLSIKTGEKFVTYIAIATLAAAFMGIGIFYIRKKSHEINTNFKF